MKEIIERMFLMETDEVLDLFYNLPGAIEGKNYIYIPGTRENRILFVGHADTVFANPPKSVEWSGNYAKAGWAEAKERSLPFPEERRYRTAAPNTKEEPEPETEERAIAKGAITITIGTKTYSLGEYERLLKEGKIPKPGSPVKSTTEFARNTKFNSSRRANYPAGLGADDRAGLAMLWLLRETGHSLLICDVEEIGGVGARSAAESLADEIAKHQFAIEIDRAGDQEMVFYNVSTPEFEQYMQERTGFRIGTGSYTDIKDVCRAGNICGVNLAAGYLFQHTDKEMFFFDFWLRTFQAVLEIAVLEDLPRFELPNVGSASTALVKREYDDFEAYYAEYEAWRDSVQREAAPKKQALSGALDKTTPIHKLHELSI